MNYNLRYINSAHCFSGKLYGLFLFDNARTIVIILIMKALFISIISLIFILAGCDVPREAGGSYRKIPVLADREEIAEIAPLLKDALEREIVTPRHEKIFELEFVDTTGYDRILNARTSIIIASLESPGPAGQFIRNALSSRVIKGVQANEYWLAEKEDLWATGQLVVLLTAPDIDALSVRLALGGDELFQIVNNSVNERVGNWLFGRTFREGEKFEVEDSIARDYGFGIRVPRYWDWEKGSGEKRFIWLRTLEPERWVFVWWTELDSTMDFSVDSWRHIRDSLCAIYYEGDSVSPHYTPETTGTYIGGRPAVEIRALWENNRNKLGGPIVSYVFSDPDKKRLYIVDGAVFAPVIKKEPYLRHVEIVCRSFRPDVKRFFEEREKR